MSFIYLQYHNCEKQGGLPQASSTKPTRLQIHTKVASARKATGQVLIIAGMGSPRRYFLWGTFVIDRFHQRPDSTMLLEGPGWQLSPAVELKGVEFDRFRASCANFLGFRKISDLLYCKKLVQLAQQHRPVGHHEGGHQVLSPFPRSFESTDNEIVPDAEEPKVALSIRQPHVEAILRGIKKVEYRREATSRRGRILIYAAKLFAEDLPKWIKKYGFEDVDLEKLPRGVVAGSVEIYDCDEGEWYLRNPIRAKTLRRPTGRPQPIWFTPFHPSS